MADYYDQVNPDAFAYLQAWSATFMQHYAPGIADELQRFGKTTRLIPRARRVMNGSNIEYEVQAGHNRGASPTNDPMRVMPDHMPGSYTRFNVNFDHTTPANNDIMCLEASFKTTIWDIWKRSDSLFKGEGADFIRRDVEQGLADIREKFAMSIHWPTDGALGVVADRFAAGKFINPDAWVDGQGAMIIELTAATPIAMFGDGQLLEVRATSADGSGALHANGLRVRYVDPGQQYIHVELDDTFRTAMTSTPVPTEIDGSGVLNAIVATDKIYIHDGAGSSPSGSLGKFFDEGTDYYGVDRKLDGNGKMLMPLIYDKGTPAALADSDFRQMGEIIGWTGGAALTLNRRAIIMSINEYRDIDTFTSDATSAYRQVQPVLESQIGRKIMRAFGHDGFVLHDPVIGTVPIVVDDFAERGKVRFLSLSHWEICTPIDGGFRMFPGEIGGIWTRNSDPTTGQPTKVYTANGIQAYAFVSKYPKTDLELRGILID